MALTQIPSGLIADDAITSAKISSGAISAADMADSSITIAKLHSTATQLFGMRNRIINGDFRIDQRNAGASQTITGGVSTLAFNCDRWQVRSQGANASVQQVATNNTYRMVFTGLASNSGVAASQSIEALNCADMAGQTVTLSLLAKSTSLTSLTLEAYYANTTNTFGTWGSPTVTSIGSQSVAISTTESLVTYTFAVPEAATTGLQIRITSGALAATQTLTIGNVQLEVGSTATPFERRLYTTELQLCQRYFEKSFNISQAVANGTSGTSFISGYGLSAFACSNNSAPGGTIRFAVQKRTDPTMTLYGNNSGQWSLVNPTSSTSISWTTAINLSAGDGIVLVGNYAVNNTLMCVYGHWTASAEL